MSTVQPDCFFVLHQTQLDKNLFYIYHTALKFYEVSDYKGV